MGGCAGHCRFSQGMEAMRYDRRAWWYVLHHGVIRWSWPAESDNHERAAFELLDGSQPMNVKGDWDDATDRFPQSLEW